MKYPQSNKQKAESARERERKHYTITKEEPPKKETMALADREKSLSSSAE